MFYILYFRIIDAAKILRRNETSKFLTFDNHYLDKVISTISCVPWMGGSGERFPVMVAPRAVILLSAPAQGRRSLCGAVCFVVHGVVFFGLIGVIEPKSVVRFYARVVFVSRRLSAKPLKT